MSLSPFGADSSSVAAESPESARDAEGSGARVNNRPLGCLIEIAETLILTIVIFWVIQTFIAQPYRVEQQSMETTLLPDQYVLVDKLSPKWDTYSRGDIVVFNPVIRDGACTNAISGGQDGTVTPYIKRVIGEPGDVVELRSGNVLVNGVQLSEPYVHSAPTRPLGGETTWTVASDRLFVMGDNRENSTDSRSGEIGEVCQADVIGRAWLRYWPLSTIGILQTPTYPGVPSATPSGGSPAPVATARPTL